ncbi:DNA polymerase III subunit alpha [Blattabacterium cuenoti]|uniref:DNA polymerase III subunit alpha n=1 Tax=Blattabacterium cuenoti TaxID=1653831 RepID=UPI00163D04FA|nr:DNA polymerase III subunit alpha [Blattabacterium cuenoti]
MYLIIDTETTGLPIYYKNPVTDTENWPRLVQIAWQSHDCFGKILEFKNFIVKPDNYEIPFNSFKIHGITNQIAEKYGKNLTFVINQFEKILKKSEYIIGHNLEFDINIIDCEYFRINKKTLLKVNKKKILDTKNLATDYCKLPGTGVKKKFKWPKLTELYYKLFGITLNHAHNAAYDVKATARCFLELLRLGVINYSKSGIKEKIINKFREIFPMIIPSSIVSFKDVIHPTYTTTTTSYNKYPTKHNLLCDITKLKNKKYSHIHNHTCFSILHSTIKVQSLVERAICNNMPAVGITDYGNMMGVFYFLDAINDANKKYSYLKKSIKGIIGSEVFISDNYLQKQFTKDKPDKYYHQVLLSKNKAGYHNLSKLCSHGFLDGYYSGRPRVGKKLIEKYKDNLIAITGDLNAEIPYTILNYGKMKAEKIFLWWKEIFQDDFYVELLRHGLEEEDYVNQILLQFARKYNVKFIIQNNTFYLDKTESDAHDILLCIKYVKKKSTPIGTGKEYRFGFPNSEFFFKSTEEMKILFSDLPEAFDNLEELIDKIDCYQLSHPILLPKFNISKNFENTMDKIDGGGNIDENKLLKIMTYEGAKKRYPLISKSIIKRINFELNTIEKLGYPGYFLIVQNFIYIAKKMNISVGPGRGSVAGSVVAYCIGITNIDPIKYQLLFERFLNPERINLPDIDIDFDDRGRDKIIEWVVNKYGKNKVAQIITYATMGARSSIRDTARVLNLSLEKTDRLAKMIPECSVSLKYILSENFSLIMKKMKKMDLDKVKRLRNIAKNQYSLEGQILEKAKMLEGTIRSTGIHACGIIISPYDIIEYVPVAISRESDLMLTQFDNNVVEKTGLLKMDFLGLKTLTIIKDTLELLKNRTTDILLKFSLEDKKTYSLFQRGDTVAVFQYESPGMQKYLRDLKPDKFDDLIAMNALFRPGPMQYIPNFISRKHGYESITYDFPEVEQILKDTYGITIYQEQVMLISQKIANFTKVEADILRKAMGKKNKGELNKLKNKFIYNAIKNGYSKIGIEKIWKDWECFSSYAFNKSHATCYAYIAFQTAYLKTHFPCEYMASVLSNNMDNMKQLSFFIKECKRLQINIIEPDINYSDSCFTVINPTFIRFGLRGIKGVGENAVKIIMNERTKNGFYKNIFDFVERIDLRIVNKKTLESLILSGALDSFNIDRETYFYIDEEEQKKEKTHKSSIIEKIIQVGSKHHSIKKKHSIKDDIQAIIKKKNNKLWTKNTLIDKKKEVLGIDLSIRSYVTNTKVDKKTCFINLSLDQLNHYAKQIIGKTLYICGFFAKKDNMKNGKLYGIFLEEDNHFSKRLIIHGNGKKYLKYKHYNNNLSFYSYVIIFEKIQMYRIESFKKILKTWINKLILKIQLKYLNKITIDKLENLLLSQNIGNKKLYIMIYNRENKSIYFESIKYELEINYNFLKELEKIKGVDVCLN